MPAHKMCRRGQHACACVRVRACTKTCAGARVCTGAGNETQAQLPTQSQSRRAFLASAGHSSAPQCVHMQSPSAAGGAEATPSVPWAAQAAEGVCLLRRWAVSSSVGGGSAPLVECSGSSIGANLPALGAALLQRPTSSAKMGAVRARVWKPGAFVGGFRVT